MLWVILSGAQGLSVWFSLCLGGFPWALGLDELRALAPAPGTGVQSPHLPSPTPALPPSALLSLMLFHLLGFSLACVALAELSLKLVLLRPSVTCFSFLGRFCPFPISVLRSILSLSFSRFSSPALSLDVQPCLRGAPAALGCSVPLSEGSSFSWRCSFLVAAAPLQGRPLPLPAPSSLRGSHVPGLTAPSSCPSGKAVLPAVGERRWLPLGVSRAPACPCPLLIPAAAGPSSSRPSSAEAGFRRPAA